MAAETAQRFRPLDVMNADSASFRGTMSAPSVRAARDAAAGARAADRRPTVLHFIPSVGGGGAESMLINLVEAMNGSGWRTVVVAVDARPWPARAARLREITHAFHDLESPALLHAPVQRRLRSVIRAVKPDVVQTWMHHADLIGGLNARLAGVRNVVWGIHCRETHRNPGDGALKTSLFRSALSLLSHVVPRRIVSCSSAAIEDHAARGYPRRKMRWIPNGICTRTFSPPADGGLAARRELNLPDEVPIVGFAGRFHEMKQLGVFFQAAALLQARMPRVHFALCGGTVENLDDAAREALATLPRPGQAHFMPFRADMARFYPALSLFSLSSRTEACPMTLLEAMSCGVPCAATDAGDCAALLGDAACVAPVGDAAALARAWENILKAGADERAATREALKHRVEENFSIARAARDYAALYTSFLPRSVSH
jgi:glycosyltransferase involved in cell wall biosynthesis